MLKKEIAKIKSYIEPMLHRDSFEINDKLKANLLIEKTAKKNGIFEYKKYFVDFFEYMAKEGFKSYTSPEFLRHTIDMFGEVFKEAYTEAYDNCAKFKKAHPLNMFEEAEKRKNKFVGNLFEVLTVLYFSHYNIIDNDEFLLKEWCNGGEDDFLGVDGILYSENNSNIELYVNSKHHKEASVAGFDPYVKIQSYWCMQNDLVTDDISIERKHYPYKGIIFTDSVAGEIAKKTFKSIKIIDEEELLKNLGKYGKGLGHKKIWDEWLNIVK